MLHSCTSEVSSPIFCFFTFVWQTHASWPVKLWADPDSQKYDQCIDHLKDAESKLIISHICDYFSFL